MRANQKPWMTREVCMLLKTGNTAFRSGDKTALSRAVRRSKRSSARRISENSDSTRDAHHMSQGIQALTDYKPSPHSNASDVSFPDKLNDVFVRFEAQNKEPAKKATPPSTDNVRRTLSTVGLHQAAGQDNMLYPVACSANARANWLVSSQTFVTHL